MVKIFSYVTLERENDIILNENMYFTHKTNVFAIGLQNYTNFYQQTPKSLKTEIVLTNALYFKMTSGKLCVFIKKTESFYFDKFQNSLNQM